VKYRDGVGHVVVAMESKHQTSCSVKYGLEASLKIGRNSDKYEVDVVEPGMHQRHHERTEAVVGDVSTRNRAVSPATARLSCFPLGLQWLIASFRSNFGNVAFQHARTAATTVLPL